MGRGIGVPTANLELHRFKVPLAGVYVVNVLLPSGALKYGVANVGTRPTIGDRTKANLEVHIFDYDANLYGQAINVQFFKHVRDEKKFDSLDELKSTIASDIAYAKSWLTNNATS